MDNTNPLISLVLPVYNVEKYLDRCMESVVNQTYKNLEIILVDDGATDQSGKICDKWAKKDKRITVIHKENGGLSDARNVGTDHASGEYISYIDSDDTVEADYVEYLYYLVKKFHTPMSLCTHNIVFDEGKRRKPLGNGEEIVLTDKEALESMLYHGQVDTSAWAKLYNLSLAKDIKYPKGKLFEDIGTTYKFFLKAGKIACGFRPKYNYFVRSNSIVTGAFSPRKLDLLDMTDEMANNVVIQYPDLKNAALRRQVYARFSTLNQTLGVRDAVEYQKSIIDYIKKYRLAILNDVKAPKRDKAAIILLSISKILYEQVWNSFKNK